MLGGKMFSRSVLQRPNSLSLPASTVISRPPTGKMDTLCSVVRNGTTQAVYKHLHKSSLGINDEEITESGEACTPLSEAIRTRNLCTTRLLLDFGADPTQGLSDRPTTTAISLVAVSADYDLMSMVVEKASTLRREEARKAVPSSTITSLARDIRETQRLRPARKPAWVAATFL